MKISELVIELIYDIGILGLGSFGAYILFKEFVETERLSTSQIMAALRKRWYALLALATAILLFLHHLFIGLGG